MVCVYNAQDLYFPAYCEFLLSLYLKVPCSCPLTSSWICKGKLSNKTTTYHPPFILHLDHLKSCSSTEILFNIFCLSFINTSNVAISRAKLPDFLHKYVQNYIKSIFSFQLFNIKVMDSTSKQVLFEKNLTHRSPNKLQITLNYTLTLNYAHVDRLPFTCSSGFFICKISTKQCIAPQFVCNGQNDCPAGEDEMYCNCNISSMFINFNIYCMYADSQHSSVGSHKGQSIKDEIEISTAALQSFSDKPNHVTILGDWKLHCNNHFVAHSFEVYKICLFNPSTSTTKNLPTICPFGEHLKNCRYFNCTNTFKCPNSYCIPYRNICNGKWDCPNGEDEYFLCSKMQCPGFFHCIGLRTCLHPSEICDGKVDCENNYGDDEMFCSNGYKCPAKCYCLGLRILCMEKTLDVISFIPTDLQYMSLTLNQFNDY